MTASSPSSWRTTYSSLPGTGRRLAFARHLTDGRHPLTARVIVNRVRLQRFGRGLVNTPGDFGMRGEKPSHPELLDWLAFDFMEHGWSLKHLHRRILNTRAYRQSSIRHQEGEDIDSDNRFYWRMPVRRLEAEIIRDAMLATAGTLNQDTFGEALKVTADENNLFVIAGEAPRRSIYAEVLRTKPATLLETFDAPSMEPNCERRESSTVTTQALSMLNNKFSVDQARAFAQRILATGARTPAEQIKRVWELALLREPPPSMPADALAYLEIQTRHFEENPPKPVKDQPAPDPAELALATLCQSLFASNPFLYLE